MNRHPGIKLKDLTEITGGRIEGDPQTRISGINTLEEADSGDLSFLSSYRYLKLMKTTKASCVLVPEDFKSGPHPNLLRVKNVQLAFTLAARELCGEKVHPLKGISKKSIISPSARISPGAAVGDFSVIGEKTYVGEESYVYPQVYIGRNCRIGKECVIYPGVKIMDSVKIGDGVIIHSGAVIGSDGFGYTLKDGRRIKTAQMGGVEIGDRVEIGANTTIDRGSASPTRIGEGTKIDNLVQIAHNVQVGKKCIIVSQAGIAGSTVIEDGAVLAGQAGVVGHIRIGKGAKVGAQAGVTRNVADGALVSGYPATEHRKARKLNALTRKLPELFKKVEELKKKIEEGKD